MSVTVNARSFLQELVTDDAYLNAACFARWPHEYAQLSRGPYLGRIQKLVLPHMDIVREQVNRSVEQRGSCPPGTYSFSTFTTAGCHAKYPDAQVYFGDAQLHNEQYERRLISDEDADAITITVDREWLDRIGEPLGIASTRSSSSGNLAVGRVLTWALEALEVAKATPALLDQPVWGQGVSHLIAEGICAAFEERDSGAVGAGISPRATLVERARDAILAEDCELRTIGWVCRHLGVSRSTLQCGFVAEVGMAPLAYLRMQRLGRCRKELLEPDSATTVLDVAVRWGFWHPGRFSRYYRDMFGESPSSTLTRAKGSN